MPPPTYRQRDLVKVRKELPTGEVLRHPFLILSCHNSNSQENFYTGVMMTASTHYDGFSFRVDNTMFERPLEKTNCQLRLYILASFRAEDVEQLLSRMKKIHFQQVIDEIKAYTLCVDN